MQHLHHRILPFEDELYYLSAETKKKIIRWGYVIGALLLLSFGLQGIKWLIGMILLLVIIVIVMIYFHSKVKKGDV